MNAPNLLTLARTIHSSLFHSAPLTDDATRHAFLEAFVRQANAAAPVGLGRWGRKSRASHGGPVSSGTVGYWLADAVPVEPMDGLLDAVDLISGSGGVQWLVDPPAEYQNILAMWYPVVGAPDIDPHTPPDDGDHPDDDDPDVNMKALIEVLADLHDVADRLVMAIVAATTAAEGIRHDGIKVRLGGA